MTLELQPLGQKLRRAGGTVTQDNDVGMVRFQNFGGVFEGFTLVRLEAEAEILITSALSRNAASSNDVRVRVLGSTKKFTSVFPRKARDFFDLAGADLLESIRSLENEIDLVGRQFAQSEQVFAVPARVHVPTHSLTNQTPSSEPSFAQA